MTSLPKSLAQTWDAERLTADTDPALQALELQRQASARPPMLPPIGGTPEPMPTAQASAAPVEDNTPVDFSKGIPTMADLGFPDAPATPMSPPAGQSGTPQAMPTVGGSSGGAAYSGPSGGTVDHSSREAFIASMLPYAKQAEAQTGIPAEVMMAINLNEQGWQHDAPGNNYFGIKGVNPRTGASTGPVNTWEDYGNGRQNIQDTFRAYDSPAESYADFGNFLKDNSRYGPALQRFQQTGDAAQLVRDIHAAGYATDPDWSSKINSIASDVRRNMPQILTAGAPPEPQFNDPSNQIPNVEYDPNNPGNPRDQWQNMGSAAMLADNAPNSSATPNGSSGTIKGMPVADALAMGGQFQLGGPDDGSTTTDTTGLSGENVQSAETISQYGPDGSGFVPNPNAGMAGSLPSSDTGGTGLSGTSPPTRDDWRTNPGVTPDLSASPPSGAAEADPGGGAASSPPVEQPNFAERIGSAITDFITHLTGGAPQANAPVDGRGGANQAGAESQGSTSDYASNAGLLEAPQRPATPENFNLPAAEHAAQNADSVAGLSDRVNRAGQAIQDTYAGVGQQSEQDAADAQQLADSGPLGTALVGANTITRTARDAALASGQLIPNIVNSQLPEAINRENFGTDVPLLGRVGLADAVPVPDYMGVGFGKAGSQAPNITERIGGRIGKEIGALNPFPKRDGTVPEMASGVVSGAGDAGQQYDRYYHGTGGDFARPDPGKFDPNGLFGPGYYITDSPAVAGGEIDAADNGFFDINKGYAQKKAADPSAFSVREAELDYYKGMADRVTSPEDKAFYQDRVRIAEEELRQPQTGPNIRPIDVPRDLNLLDADAPVSPEVQQRIAEIMGPDALQMHDFLASRGGLPTQTGNDLYLELKGTPSVGSAENANKILQAAGYDGIKYAGGKRIPMTAADGSAIEHNAIAIFPESLDKIRNATAGTPGGFVPRTPPGRGSSQAVDEAMVKMGTQAIQGAVAGGVGEAQNDPNATPADILKAAGTGAVQRVAMGQVRGALGGRGSGIAAQAIRGAARASQAAPEALPIELTDAQEARRINIDRLVPPGVDQSVKDLIVNNAHSADWFHEQRRGVRPDDLVAHDAQAINEARAVDDWIRGGKAGKSYNPEETVALRNAYLTQSKLVDDLGKALDKPLTTADRDQMMAHYLNESTKLRGLAEVAEGARAEAGRTLRQYAEWGKLLEADPTLHARRYLDKLFGGTDGAQEVLRNYQQMQSDGATPQALANFLRQTGDPNFLQRWGNRLQIIRYANMLSGTLTHIINTEGTLLNAAAEAGPVKLGAVAIDMARNFYLNGAEREVFAGEILPQLRGGLAGTLEGVRQIPEILKTGVTMDEATKLEHLHSGFASGSDLVDAVVESPLRMLKAEDALTTSISRGGHLAELATRQALKEGLKGSAVESRMREILSDPVTNWKLFEQATAMAKRDAFQEERALTNWLARGKNLGGTVGAIFNTIMPFTKTPTNIAAQGLGYTPLGFADVIKSARAGNTGEAEMAASRALLGSGVTYLGVNLATSGYLTGDYPKEESERSTLPQGWKPWSVKIPKADGSTLYLNYSNMGPVGIPLAIGAIVGDAMKRGDDPSSWLPQAAVGVGKFMTDSTFLQGLSQFTAALTDANKVENFAEGLATQWMPAAAMQRQIQNALGMAQRDPHGAIEALLATSPLTADQVPEKQDRLGRTVLPTQTGLGAVIAPTRYGVSQPDPVMDAFRDAGISLSAPPKFITDETVRAPLSREEQATYQSYVGDILQRRVRPGLSEKRIQDIYDEAKHLGREYMIRQIGRGNLRARARGEVTVP